MSFLINSLSKSKAVEAVGSVVDITKSMPGLAISTHSLGFVEVLDND